MRSILAVFLLLPAPADPVVSVVPDVGAYQTVVNRSGIGYPPPR